MERFTAVDEWTLSSARSQEVIQIVFDTKKQMVQVLE
jgi:hypothetical protein